MTPTDQHRYEAHALLAAHGGIACVPFYTPGGWTHRSECNLVHAVAATIRAEGRAEGLREAGEVAARVSWMAKCDITTVWVCAAAPYFDRIVADIAALAGGACSDTGIHGRCELASGHTGEHRNGEWTWRVLSKTGAASPSAGQVVKDSGTLPSSQIPPQSRAGSVPECLRPLSSEELARAPRLTKEQINEALERGMRDREAAEAATRGQVLSRSFMRRAAIQRAASSSAPGAGRQGKEPESPSDLVRAELPTDAPPGIPGRWPCCRHCTHNNEDDVHLSRCAECAAT